MDHPNNVKFLRLVTGEDIIAEVTEFESEDDEHYILSNPMKILYISGKTGTMTVSMMQWVYSRICDHQTFDIYPEDILLITEPTADIIEYYWNSVEYYNDVLQGKNVKGSMDDDLDEALDDDESLKMIQEMLQELRKDKGKLH